MPYGKLRRVLSEEFHGLGISTILLESPFIETSRSGRYLYSVQLALTPDEIIIAFVAAPTMRRISKSKETKYRNIILQYLYPLKLVQIKVFKNSRRQSLKFSIETGKIRYFELASMEKRKIFWELWCYHTSRLRGSPTLESYVNKLHQTVCINIKENKESPIIWHDKYLYWGSKREKEDSVRPIPVPGLGPTEDIKLLYQKQKYFGCFEQSEHWVQCGSQSVVFRPLVPEYFK